MITRIRQLFKTKDEKFLDEATVEFDVMMDDAEKYEVDMTRLDGNVPDESGEVIQQVTEDAEVSE